MWNKLLILFALGLTVFAGGAEAQRACGSKPLFEAPERSCMADDVVLPLPNGGSIYFRKVVTPESSFWSTESRRRPKLGADNQNYPFEQSARMEIGGSFQDENERYYFLLGKFELSKGQAALILGDGDLTAGLRELAQFSHSENGYADLAEQVGRRLGRAGPADLPPALQNTLAEPLLGVSVATINRVIDQYNLWCLNEPDCLSRITDSNGVNGYIRLPAEFEWEYAARGGYDAIQGAGDSPGFEDTLPFDETRIDRYANLSSQILPIGSLHPSPGGFYDFFGNVKELCADAFTTSLLDGRLGGRVARGGDYQLNPSAARASLREEAPLYLKIVRRGGGGAVEPARSPTMGVRLAVGSLIFPSPADVSRLEEAYRAAARVPNDAGQGLTTSDFSLLAPIIRSREPAQIINEVAQALREMEGGQNLGQTLQSAQNRLQADLNEQVSKSTELLVKLSINGLFAIASTEYTIQDLETYVVSVRSKIVENQNLIEGLQRQGVNTDAFVGVSATLRDRLSGALNDLQRNQDNLRQNYRETRAYVNELLSYEKNNVEAAIQRERPPDGAFQRAKNALVAIVEQSTTPRVSEERIRMMVDRAFQGFSFQ